MEILLGIAGVCLVVGWLIPSPLSWWARRRLRLDNRALREHLHVKMEIDADGLAMLREENLRLTQMNENLRITVQTLKCKPGRSELRLLHIYDRAVNIMLKKVPNFAPSWQRVLEHVEKDYSQTDSGVRAFVKRVFRPAALLSHTTISRNKD